MADDNLRLTIDPDTVVTLMGALAYAVAALERLPVGWVAVREELPALKAVMQRWVPDDDARARLVKNAHEILAGQPEELERPKAV